MQTKVFIAYGREDAEYASRLYHDLKSLGVDPWLDTKCLSPGIKWKPAIASAMKDSTYVMVLLSSRSANRRGFLNKEISDALDLADQHPDTLPFLIPVYLDECSPSHQRLLDLHRIEMFPSWEDGLRKLRQMFRVGSEHGQVGAIIMLKVKPSQQSGTEMAQLKQLRDQLHAIAPFCQVRLSFGWHDLLVFLDMDDIEDLGHVSQLLSVLEEIQSSQTIVHVPFK